VPATPEPPPGEDESTTKGKIDRVVNSLLAIAGVATVLALAFAYHTSPRRRVRLAERRAAERSTRLAAAASVADMALDPDANTVFELPDPRPRPRDSGTDA
jgi:hypothetical protein